MGLTPGENLANPRHLSYHLPWKLGHVTNYFVNIQGAGFIVKDQIPLNPPLLKGDFNTPPLEKGGRGDFHLPG